MIWEDRRISTPSGDMPGRLWLPREDVQGLPLTVFLHGSGERGTDGIAPTTVGLGEVLEGVEGCFDSVVLFPQLPEGEYWSESWLGGVFAALPQLRAERHLDRGRTYFTGVSLGGNGVYRALVMRSEPISGAVVACGFVEGNEHAPGPQPEAAQPFEDLASRIGSTPIWLFHGSQDPVVDPGQSRELFKQLVRVGSRHARLTEAGDRRHGVWDLAFTSTTLDWLLAQK